MHRQLKPTLNSNTEKSTGQIKFKMHMHDIADQQRHILESTHRAY